MDKVYTYAHWAKKYSTLDTHDIDAGIDLVAKTEQGEFYAVQCKFYNPSRHYSIKRKDLDSFITASARSQFSGRIFIETTGCPWSVHAENAYNSQEKSSQKITLGSLRDSSVNWQYALKGRAPSKTPKKDLRAHQKKAKDAVLQAFREEGHERGMMVMACGTGKTLVSLNIAQDLCSEGGSVLCLCPSLALVNQMISAYHQDASSTLKLRSFAVCSDVSVGKKRSEGIIGFATSELVIPPTTDAQKLSLDFKALDNQKVMRVVFATYHSIRVIISAQKDYGLGEFDLVIADEAHCTTGVSVSGKEKSYFLQMHNQEDLKAKKRLYMTATPRIYAASAYQKASQKDATLVSMDDIACFGEVLFHYSFADALKDNLLSDYRIIILHLPQDEVIKLNFKNLADVPLDDAAKMIGCWKGINKFGFDQEDAPPLQKLLAFTSRIEYSKNLCKSFSKVIEQYQSHSNIEHESYHAYRPRLKHVDGSQSSMHRSQVLRWLAEENTGECRMVSNVRCLSEGVDVPSLDGIVFFHPKKSQQEVVQAVGRVMRKATGKQFGYIIIPVVTPSEEEAYSTLQQDKPYETVVQVINALRSHDSRLDAEIHGSKMDLDQDFSELLKIVPGVQIAVEENFVIDDQTKGPKIDIGSYSEQKLQDRIEMPSQESSLSGISAQVIHRLIRATVVKHCYSAAYWPEWAKDVGKIARTTMKRIEGILATDSHAKSVFEQFLLELQDDLNPSTSEKDAIEMLSQHCVSRPIFEALFSTSGFQRKNPVSQSMDKLLEMLWAHNIEAESKTLNKFYQSVKERASKVKTTAGKQNLIKELYDQFFRLAFPHTTDMLGIAYTPPVIVDFILRSVDEVLKREFGSSLSTKGVDILDPFTGTGTFIARLLELDLISPEDLEHKYAHELHANDIVLLAYYIAAVNIETAYTQKVKKYASFPGICFTDTFTLDEEDQLQQFLPVNSKRIKAQQKRDIQVIIGNPPYSAGQKNENDNAKNVKYDTLDARIRSTYAEHSTGTNKNSLYDSYIRAIRWASDRIEGEGVVGFITNGSWLRGMASDGMRKCLAAEFSSLYIFDLRGDGRTTAEKQRKDGGKIFGQSTRTPVAITFFIKTKQKPKACQIFYYSVQDYMTRKQKLDEITSFDNLF
ncbi:MAG: DEAD/DEAH box helicase family protein, partial [Proteobacteria bacterium]|nr:DEAD/DEAH box helicase family protein [Pseudomonadota bacterium]